MNSKTAMRSMTTLVVGATGSIGRHVVAQALAQGHAVRALVRNPAKATHLPREVTLFKGDVTRVQTLLDAVDGVDTIVLTLGTDGQRPVGAESVDYGIAQTQDMLDFCDRHGITSDIELVRIQDINAAFERMLKSDVEYRFVIDLASLKEAA